MSGSLGFHLLSPTDSISNLNLIVVRAVHGPVVAIRRAAGKEEHEESTLAPAMVLTDRQQRDL